MKAQARFGSIWILVTMILIFGPILFVALYANLVPESRQSPWLVAVAFSGFVLLVLVIVLVTPWKCRLMEFGGSTIKVTKVRQGVEIFRLDAGRPYSGFIAIREGLSGKNACILNRWLQARLEQDGKSLLLEFASSQELRPVKKPYDALPGPEDCKELAPLLTQDFVLDETHLNRVAERKPSAVRGNARFLECTNTPDELVAFLRTNPRTNTWRRDGISAVAI